jgi:putative chitinase
MSRFPATRALVLELQRELVARGHPLAIDGVPGPATFRAAIKQAKGSPLGIGHNGGPPLVERPAPIVRGLSEPGSFFEALKTNGLFRSLDQPQVDGINFKLAAFGRAGWPISFAAYGFATSYWETDRTMQPVREKGSGDGADADRWDDYLERYDTGPLAARLGNTPDADGDGVALAGKGDVQLTGAANYKRATIELRKRGIIAAEVDLHLTPDLVLRPDISAAIMVAGMEEGWFTGRKLSHTLPSERPATLAEFVSSRPIINGRDKDREIGAIAIGWQAALQAGGWA